MDSWCLPALCSCSPSARNFLTFSRSPALSFFAPPRAAQSTGRIAFNDLLVSRLEHDIRQEQAIVAQFVHHPSLDTLYQHPTSPNYVQ